MRAGDEIVYLQDYEIEIAEKAHVGRPITRSVLSGLLVDVRPNLGVAQDVVDLCIRTTRTEVKQPIRKVATPHGDVELPEMDWFRARTTLRAPLGERTVVATARDGDRVRVLVVTPRRLGGE